ncbi:MAG: GNAT family N-acetyltransferase [Treponema sp.]|jgi:predicted N-acetyltransferase YhbS|nr:GNAT family N-acetyltransferase [Treponema sp.]
MKLDLVPISKNIAVKSFDCGNGILNEYLKLYSRKNDTERIGRTFLALDEDGTVAGYITLSNAQVERNKLPEALKLPRYPIPALRIGKLAVDKTMQGKGLGSWLLFKSFEQVMRIAELSAVYVMIVDAIDSNAGNFYLKYGFVPLQDSELSLFLPVKTIAAEFYDKLFDE